MSWVSVAAARLRGLWEHRRLERELDEEVRFHLEMQTEDNVKAGMASAEARYAALRSFGGLEQMKEVHRERRTLAIVDSTAQDVRYAVRTLRRSPAFTTTAVAVLALAIGANTAVFSVLNAVLLRPLPYRAPERLAMLWTDDPTQNIREGRSALWDVEQWRKESQSFADIATFDSVGILLTGTDGVEPVAGASISPNLLPLLGVQPILGRGFSVEEADREQELVLISHRFWQDRFGGSPDVLGAILLLNGSSCRVAGVLPADFQIARLNADIWRPHPGHPAARGAETWFAVGRLRPAVTFDQAQAEMSTMARLLNQQRPAAERNRGISVVPLSLEMVGPRSRLSLWMLAGAVFCVFLIAAANIASLSLARGIARAQEMAVRAALGAGAGRIVRQLLTEHLILAAFAGLVGTLLAFAGIRLIRVFGPGDLPRLNQASLDLPVLGWVLGISLLAGVLVGLAPAMTARRRNLRSSGDAGRSFSSGVASQKIRRALVVAEFALAVVLLAGAGLLARSWWRVSGIDPGFRPNGVLMMELSAPTLSSTFAQRTELYRRVLEEIQAVPGVQSAGITGDLFTGNPREQVLTVERVDGTVSGRLRFTRDEVSADFFRTLGTPLLRGRFFSGADGPDAPPVALVNDAMVRLSWPGSDPVGRRFKLGPPESSGPWYTVVGVVGDMRRQGPEREALPQVFESLLQKPPQSADLFIRTSSNDPLAMADALRAAVRRVEKNAPVYGVVPLEQQLGAYLSQRRFQTSLLAGFSLVALLMAAVGIYGLIQYSIATRAHEIGIRLAVGAQAGAIFRMILGEGLKLSLSGWMLGLLGALWLGQASSSLLFGVAATDPLTFFAVSCLLIAVAVAACYFPARRAMKIDPMVALRPQ